MWVIHAAKRLQGIPASPWRYRLLHCVFVSWLLSFFISLNSVIIHILAAVLSHIWTALSAFWLTKFSLSLTYPRSLLTPFPRGPCCVVVYKSNFQWWCKLDYLSHRDLTSHFGIIIATFKDGWSTQKTSPDFAFKNLDEPSVWMHLASFTLQMDACGYFYTWGHHFGTSILLLYIHSDLYFSFMSISSLLSLGRETDLRGTHTAADAACGINPTCHFLSSPLSGPSF